MKDLIGETADDGVAEGQIPEPQELGEAGKPVALVGAGNKMVKVRANAGAMGLQSGQVAILSATEEVRANVENGNLAELEG